MNGKENQRIALTKRLLQEALFRLLSKKTLAKVSVSELCKEAGINRATFYKYYGCPEDVLAAIKEDFFNDLLISQQQGTDKKPQSYTETFEAMCTYLYNNKEKSKQIIKNLNFNIAEVLENLAEGRNGMYEYLPKYFNGDSDSIKLAASFIAYGIYSLVRKWLAEDIDKTPKEITEIFFKLTNNELYN